MNTLFETLVISKVFTRAYGLLPRPTEESLSRNTIASFLACLDAVDQDKEVALEESEEIGWMGFYVKEKTLKYGRPYVKLIMPPFTLMWFAGRDGLDWLAQQDTDADFLEVLKYASKKRQVPVLSKGDVLEALSRHAARRMLLQFQKSSDFESAMFFQLELPFKDCVVKALPNDHVVKTIEVTGNWTHDAAKEFAMMTNSQNISKYVGHVVYHKNRNAHFADIFMILELEDGGYLVIGLGCKNYQQPVS